MLFTADTDYSAKKKREGDETWYTNDPSFASESDSE
jgi:hypothetical protein